MSSRYPILIFVSVFLVLAGCATSPTGRSQFIILSPEQEMQMGFSSFEQMKKDVPISNDPAGNDQLQRVGKRISEVVDLPGAQWEFVLFESEQVNAFCLPGGKVGVYEGILPIMRDDEGMATVIGHEVAHAVARHGGERVSNAMAIQAGGSVVGALASGYDPEIQAAASTVYGLGLQLGYALPHSRTQESEADELGLYYMARAGYNPEAAVGFWQRFKEYSDRAGGDTPWFLRTHPTDETRIENIKKWLPKANAQYRPR